MYFLIKILPKNIASYFFGWFSRIKFVYPLNIIVNRFFVFLFRIDMKEATKPLRDYKTLEELFIRTIDFNLRPKDTKESDFPLLFPCDGTLVVSQKAQGNQALQVKGVYYSLLELIGQKDNSSISLDWFTTIYLAPYNYHRVHSPCNGKLFSIEYIPGDLWPVNEKFVGLVPELFCKNERLVFTLEAAPSAFVYIVMVGALNVGRISSSFLKDFVTNDNFFSVKKEFFNFSDQSVFINAGDELGIFRLGSTVVMAFDRECSKVFQYFSTLTPTVTPIYTPTSVKVRSNFKPF